jgi:hypothetical protein
MGGEENGIDALIKNDSSDAFFGAPPQVVDLYIQNDKLSKAKAIIMNLNKK